MKEVSKQIVNQGFDVENVSICNGIQEIHGMFQSKGGTNFEIMYMKHLFLQLLTLLI